MAAWTEQILSGIFMWLFITMTKSQQTCQLCNCIVSEDVRQPKGNVNVRTQCQEGRIDWPNPYGGVQLQFRTNFVGEFRSCLVFTTQFTTLKISQEIDNKLKHLLTINGKSSEYCIDSLKPVFLYLETEHEPNIRTEALTRVSVEYDIERLHRKLLFDPLEDCRPCDNQELMRSYCSSDYVIEGSILRVRNSGDETNIHVHIRRLIQHRQRHTLHMRRYETETQTHGTISALRKCGVQYGGGIYLFTGRVKLGRMRFGCAMPISQWEALKSRGEQTGDLECSHD